MLLVEYQIIDYFPKMPMASAIIVNQSVFYMGIKGNADEELKKKSERFK